LTGNPEMRGEKGSVLKKKKSMREGNKPQEKKCRNGITNGKGTKLPKG